MKIPPVIQALGIGVLIVVILTACAQAAPQAQSQQPPTVVVPGIEGITPVVETVQAHFNPTEAVGGGANSSNPVTDPTTVFAAVQEASKLKITANSSPPGATGSDVDSVSVIAQDSGGLLKSLDAAGKQTLGNALLSAAAAAWPNANISLLVNDPAGSGGTIIGNRPKGGQNTVIAT